MKVLIVDDSVVFRTFMRTCLAGMPELEIVGAVSDGQKALESMATLKPDLITLDMEMPKLGGLELLERLRSDYPQVKVIIVSCSTETDAIRTVKALELGAFDFILKPKADENDPQKYLQELLFPRIKKARSLQAMVGAKPIQSSASREKGKLSSTPDRATARVKFARKYRPDLIAIGSSTGGPAALHTVLEGLPASFPVPITITQHMPKLFIKSLAERLDQCSKLSCVVAEQGEVLKAGHVYLAPGDTHMKIKSQGVHLIVHLEEGPRVNHSIPSVDVTYDSLVELSPRVKTLALILTGLGNDGAKGAKRLAEKKNHIMIQDEKSSVVWGMPGEAFRLGAVDETLPLTEIADALVFHVR